MTTHTTSPTLFDYIEDAMQNPTDLDVRLDATSWLESPRVQDGVLRRDLAVERALIRFRRDFAGATVEVRHCHPEQKNPEANWRLVYITTGVLQDFALNVTQYPTRNSTKPLDHVVVKAEYGMQAVPVDTILEIEVVAAA